MTDLINCFSPTPPGVKTIRIVQDIGVGVAHVFVSVNDAGGNRDENGIINTHANHNRFFAKSLPVFPKVEIKLSVNESETIGLVSVLVRTSCDPRMGDAYVAHCGLESLRQFIVPKKFDQPTSRIGMILEGTAC